jgi:hypothetical protein
MRPSTASGERSDQIGELGEIKFKELCSLANLHCSKVEPDKTGKDYIVEFRSQSFSPTISYDKREAPIQVIVQVKTISAKNNRVKIAASVAERLAKDLRPAIICILKIDDHDKFTAMHFLEIVDKNLEKVLKRLRVEYRNENNKLHKSELSFGPSEGHLVDMVAGAVYAKMSSLASPTMEEYAARKNGQIQTLGYAEHRYSLKFTFDAETEEDIADGLLGLKPLRVLEHTETEHRFDIPLPHDGLLPHTDGAILSIESGPDDSGVLIVIDKATGSEMSVSADWRSTPMNLVPGSPRALIRWHNGSIKLSFGDRALHATVKVAASKELVIPEWLQEMQFLAALFGQNCELKFRSSRGEISLGSLTWPSQIGGRDFGELIHCVSGANDIFDLAGAAQQKTSLKSMIESRNQLKILVEMISKGVRISAHLKDSPVSELSNASGVFVSSVPIADTWIGVSIPMVVSVQDYGSDTMWTGTKNGEAHVEMLCGNISENFERFRAKTMKISNAECAFVQRPGDFLSEGGTLLEYVDKSAT